MQQTGLYWSCLTPNINLLLWPHSILPFSSVTYLIHCEGRSELTDNTLNCVDSLYSEISALFLSHTTTASQACRVINNFDRLVCPSVNNRVTVTTIDQPMIRIKAQLTAVISSISMTLMWYLVAAVQSLRWGGVFATGRKRRQRDDSVSFLVKSRLTSCHSAEASGVWRGKTGDNHRVHREDKKKCFALVNFWRSVRGKNTTTPTSMQTHTHTHSALSSDEVTDACSRSPICPAHLCFEMSSFDSSDQQRRDVDQVLIAQHLREEALWRLVHTFIVSRGRIPLPLYFHLQI